MENDHSWRLRRFPEIIDKSSMKCAGVIAAIT
jgi:hypothetical protein